MTDADFAAVGDWTDPGAAAGVHVLLHDGAGRVLLQLRDGEPGAPAAFSYPGLWSFFGGGVEAGETLREAALRELEEETGLVVSTEALAPYARVLSRWGTGRRRLYVFASALPGGLADIRLGEGAGFALMGAGQAERAAVIPEFRAVLGLFFAGRRPPPLSGG